MDKQSIATRRWIQLLGGPIFWLPAVVGCFALTMIPGPIGGGLAVAGFGFSLFQLGWGMTVGKPALTQAVVEQLRAEEQQKHLGELRELRRKLRTDHDSRTGKCVRDLRDMYRRMSQHNLLQSENDPQITREVKQQTAALYHSCVASLDRAHTLWKAAQEMRTEQKRDELLDEREKIIDEVNAGLDNLGRTLDHLQTVELSHDEPEERLGQIRQELEQGLEVARNVQARLDRLDRDLQRPDLLERD